MSETLAATITRWFDAKMLRTNAVVHERSKYTILDKDRTLARFAFVVTIDTAAQVRLRPVILNRYIFRRDALAHLIGVNGATLPGSISLHSVTNRLVEQNTAAPRSKNNRVLSCWPFNRVKQDRSACDQVFRSFL